MIIKSHILKILYIMNSKKSRAQSQDVSQYREKVKQLYLELHNGKIKRRIGKTFCTKIILRGCS